MNNSKKKIHQYPVKYPINSFKVLTFLVSRAILRYHLTIVTVATKKPDNGSFKGSGKRKTLFSLKMGLETSHSSQK